MDPMENFSEYIGVPGSVFDLLQAVLVPISLFVVLMASQ